MLEESLCSLCHTCWGKVLFQVLLRHLLDLLRLLSGHTRCFCCLTYLGCDAGLLDEVLLAQIACRAPGLPEDIAAPREVEIVRNLRERLHLLKELGLIDNQLLVAWRDFLIEGFIELGL